MEETMRLVLGRSLCAFVPVFLISSVSAAEMSDEQLIDNAMSAAPKAVAENATVVAFDANMSMRTLREGTNGFTCMPDDQATPSNDPMCADANGMEWVHALMTKTPPPTGKIGFGYMLQGETAASNTDPYAAPPADGKWSEAGPHVMIFNVSKEMMAGYPRPGDKPDATQPFVMWQDTPYEHLMIPTE
jgi:hypothetical protein